MKWLLTCCVFVLLGQSAIAGIVRVIVSGPCINDQFCTLNNYGTGISVARYEGGSVVLTAGHLFSGPFKSVSVHGFPGKVVYIENSNNGVPSDFALIEVPGASFNVSPLGDDPTAGQVVGFTGYVRDGPPKFGQGQVLQQYWIRGVITHGQSGGPVSDNESILGVLSAVGKSPEGGIVYTPISKVKPHLAEYLKCATPPRNQLTTPPPPGSLDVRMSDSDKVKHLDKLYQRLEALEESQQVTKASITKLQAELLAALGGIKGTQGPPGVPGKDGTQGPQGERGPPGKDGSSGTLPTSITFRVLGENEQGETKQLATTTWTGQGPVDIILPPLMISAALIDHKNTEDTADDEMSQGTGKYRYGENIPIRYHINVLKK